MQLLSDKFTFKKSIEEYVNEYYNRTSKSISKKLDEMYISNFIKRPIIRTLDILNDVVKVQGQAPERIFIEMARGADDEQKGKRIKTRYEQLIELYKKVKDEDIPRLSKEPEGQNDKVLQRVSKELEDHKDNDLQSRTLFLYFLQLGKSMYTGKSIDINSITNGDGTYNIEHIYPRSFVKDDSIINNLVLVESEINGRKQDTFPVDVSIRQDMHGYWSYLHKVGLVSDEKYKRLTRTTPFTDEEKFEFINRQLVETSQSTKAVATLLKEMYPETEIVFVKAGTVSDFRQKFKLPKSRAVNDLHHAKDAYLNIVVGNVFHCKFSKQFWRKDEPHNAKVEVIFNHPVECNGTTVWNGAKDKDRVVKIAGKNTAHITKYAFCKKGGFFWQMPKPAKEGLSPIKKDRPTEKYGGYNSSTASFFVLVKYKTVKNRMS